VSAEPPHHIVIDGNFDDWIPVRKYEDPKDDEAGTVLQGGTPDCHDTDSKFLCDHPPHVYNPHADLIEYAFTHDEKGVYGYMKAVGNISLTAESASDAGRSYIQVMLDMDTYIPTGYCTNEGGYYPPGCGYDMHFELEMYNGTMNTAHIILHAMNSTAQYEAARQEQMQGIVNFGAAAYHPYTEWVYWSASSPPTSLEASHCQDGPHTLPNGDIICFVVDKCPCLGLQGMMEYAFSKDWTMVEMSAPYPTFMHHPSGIPVLQLGQKVNVMFALETSGQYSTPYSWVSDASWPIFGYLLAP
jgi:hypothetical protein